MQAPRSPGPPAYLGLLLPGQGPPSLSWSWPRKVHGFRSLCPSSATGELGKLGQVLRCLPGNTPHRAGFYEDSRRWRVETAKREVPSRNFRSFVFEGLEGRGGGRSVGALPPFCVLSAGLEPALGPVTSHRSANLCIWPSPDTPPFQKDRHGWGWRGFRAPTRG